MAISAVDICNMALDSIGAGRISSLTEASPEARACSLWYDNVRKKFLRAAFWPFARKSASLSLRGDGQGSWAYSYTYPPDCLLARFIDSKNGKFPPFVVATEQVSGGTDKVILTNVESPVLWYTFDNEDISTWDPMAIEAFVDALAGSLAMPLSGKRSIAIDRFQKANATILQARGAANQEMRLDFSYTPTKIAAREWDSLKYESSPFIQPDGPLFM